MSQRSTSSLISDKITRFERGVVFRVARGYFVALALLAVLVFVGGAVMAVRGMSKGEIPAPPVPAAPPARAPLSINAVQAELGRLTELAAQDGNTIDLKSKPGQDTSVTVTEQDQLKAAVKKLQALFPDPPYSWDNELEKTCTAPTSFGCLQYGTRVKRLGVVGAISKVFEDMTRVEAIDYLGVVAELLKQAPVEKRLELVAPIVSAERRARTEHEALVAKHDRAVKEMKEKYQLEVDLNNAKYAEWRQQGLYGLAAGFSLLIVVSLFLAFLSMERHTRVLEQLVGEGVIPVHGRSSAPPEQ